MREKIYESLAALDKVSGEKRKSDNNNDPRKPRIRTSMLSMCERKVVYHALQFPETPLESPNSLITLGIGTKVHELVQDGLQSQGWITNCEASMWLGEFFLTGHRDGDCHVDDDKVFHRCGPNGEKQPNAVWEFKTINNDGFTTLLFKNQPKADHVHQVNTYMALTGYKKAIITYVNKNGTLPRLLSPEVEKNASLKNFLINRDSYLLDFHVDFDADLWNNVTVPKLTRLNKAIDEGEKIAQSVKENLKGSNLTQAQIEKTIQLAQEAILPPKIDSYYECGFCAYRPICRTGRKKTK